MISCYDVNSVYRLLSLLKKAEKQWHYNAVTKCCQIAAGGCHCRQSGTCNMIHQTRSCRPNPCSDAWHPRLHGRPGLIIAVMFQLDSASLVHCTPYGIPRSSLHNMTATTAERVAAVVQLQRQNVQHGSVLLRVLRLMHPGI